MSIGEEIRNAAFRDTATYYLHAQENLVHPGLLRFAIRHCGKRVLDLGCANGNYMVELQQNGFECVGADVNPAYVELAKQRGLEAYHVGETLPFPDKSFDSVLLFEVLEHLPDPFKVLLEVQRVARNNILITVPNCEGYNALGKHGLMFEHFLDLDHKHFFTERTLREELARLFSDVEVDKGDPILPLLVKDRSLLNLLFRGLMKLGILRPRFFFRLYAVIHLAK